MLLPPELLTVVFLTGLTAVRAQADDPSAALSYTTASDVPSVVSTLPSAPSLFPTGDSNDIGAPAPTPTASEPPPEPQPPDDVDACDLPDPPEWCGPPDFVQPELPTATGWDDWGEWGGGNIIGGSATTALLEPSKQTPVVITTRTPTVVEIRTSVDPSGPGLVGGVWPTQSAGPGPPGGGQTEKQKPPAQPTVGQQAPQTGGSGKGDMPQGSPGQPAPERPAPGAPVPAQSTAGLGPNTNNVPAWGQTSPSGNDLLDAIILQLGKAQPGAQPSQVIPRPTGVPGEHINQETVPTGTLRAEQGDLAQSGGTMTGSITSGIGYTASGHDTVVLGNTITFGSATLSLTPGLSTIIGSGSDTTLIAIQTDSASHTIITISSSGTAVTATITNAPATVTLPITGFEASITGDGGRGVGTSRAAVTAVTTSSKGAANGRSKSKSGLAGCVLAILGFISMS